MARTKRAQVLMEPEEYARLEAIAAQQGCSVAELIRTAVRDRYLTAATDRLAIVESWAAMDVAIGDWPSLKAELEGRHDAGLP